MSVQNKRILGYVRLFIEAWQKLHSRAGLYIGTTRMILIPYTSSKKQGVLMRLVNICTQQKKIGTVTTTTGGTVSMTRVGLRAITATTWQDCIEILMIVYTTSKDRDDAAQSRKWMIGDLVTISMSGTRLMIKDGVRVQMVTEFLGLGAKTTFLSEVTGTSSFHGESSKKILGKYSVKWDHNQEIFEDVTTVLSNPKREVYEFGSWNYPDTDFFQVNTHRPVWK